MRKYLISEEGNFYKANLHCHSTFSDGKKTPEEIKELYKSLGYSVVAFTDHDIMIAHDELNDEEFLTLHGFEMEVNEQRVPFVNRQYKTCHMCFIALDPDNLCQPMWHRSKYLFGHAPEHKDEVKFDETLPDYERGYTGEAINEMMKNAKEHGFFVTYNHPTWSQEKYPQYINYEEMHAFEILNGSCNAAGYLDDNPRVYNDFLDMGKRVFAIGADDNHNVKPDDSRFTDSGRAFTVIKAPSLEYKCITDALLAGNFYASEGPKITELYFEDGSVTVKCSDADRIVYSCGKRSAGIAYAERGSVINEATFNVAPDSRYFFITVIDKTGARAYTNAFFTDELEF